MYYFMFLGMIDRAALGYVEYWRLFSIIGPLTGVTLYVMFSLLKHKLIYFFFLGLMTIGNLGNSLAANEKVKFCVADTL